MLVRRFQDLPKKMQNLAVKPYYEILDKKRGALFAKRAFDIFVSTVLLLILSPVLLLVALLVKLDSKGPVFFRQPRMTQNMREFRIFKFRTMVNNAETLGPLVTTGGDNRITRMGGFLRKTRIDEFPQFINVLVGDMSMVGTRPEVQKYVDGYTDEMLATLLLPAGITSRASIYFKDEAEMLQNAESVDDIYVQKILPEKMKYNLEYTKSVSLWGDIKTMLSTVFAVFRD